MSIEQDIATLRWPFSDVDVHEAALDRVVAELERLRERELKQRKRAQDEEDRAEKYRRNGEEIVANLVARAEAAEAALAKLEHAYAAAVVDAGMFADMRRALEEAIGDVKLGMSDFSKLVAAVHEYEARALAAGAERDAIGAALGEPCAECGHIDWRSDGYVDSLVAQSRAEVQGWRELFSQATQRAESAEAERDALLAKLDAERTAGNAKGRA